MTEIDINRPALYLKGKELNGWKVLQRITKDNEIGRGHFAESYLVQRGDGKALMKVLDFSVAMLSDDPTERLIELSKTYEFEKELLQLCRSQKLTKVVNILDSGKVSPMEGSIIPAPYFILEFAEKDIESQINFDSRLNIAWILKILHNTTVGLWQLHKQQVAHKNVKPSTVLDFGQSIYKITELGRAHRKGIENPLDKMKPLEDPIFATPEYLYGHNEADWIYNSQAADIYALGNLAFFLFTQSSFNTWFHFFLDDSHKWNNWGGTYKQVLPYLIEAFDKAVYYFIPFIEDEELASELEITVRQLCHPDPRKRGHPKNFQTAGSSLSVERFISKFDRLAKIAARKV